MNNNIKKNLVILTSRFPMYWGENFLEDEIIYTSKHYEKIIILCFFSSRKLNSKERILPNNVYTKNINIDFKPIDYLKIIYAFKYKFVFDEILKIFKEYKFGEYMKCIKNLNRYFINGVIIYENIIQNIELKSLLNENTIFYSYWNDYKALSLALLKKDHNIIAVSRIHGWDVDINRHSLKYLPFKYHITSSLNHSYCISENGRLCLNQMTNNAFSNKISISRLGKDNDRIVNKNKIDNKVVFVSCSTLIPLKRIPLLINLLAQIDIPNIEWYHYGDGYLRDEIKLHASNKLTNVKFQFLGRVKNEILLDFYSTNYVDLFMNVSETEGIPVSIMEAQSAGIPVLATNVGGTSEIVNHENGFLVDKDFDVIQIANMIKEFLLSDNKTITNKRNNSYNNWLKNYKASVVYNDFYNQLNNLEN